ALSRNHLARRTAAFFCYGDDGANEEGADGVPKLLAHREWFEAAAQPYRSTTDGDRLAFQGLVWQCRYSDVEVPDALWRHTTFGAGRPFADDQAEDMIREKDAMAVFD